MGRQRFDDLAVCPGCVHDVTLRRRTSEHLSEGDCSFCGATAAAPFEQFMDIVMEAVHFLFVVAEGTDAEVLDPAEVAYAVCEGDVTDDVLEAVAAAIADRSATDFYRSKSSSSQALGWGWNAFCEKVKHTSRFVFLSAPEQPPRRPGDFTTVELLEKLEKIILDHDTLLPVPAGRIFWRGRKVDSPGRLAQYGTAAALGSPPRAKASNSRMSPAGISMFYGSDDIDTVVAEIGHDARRYVIVGAFETTRDLTLLNLADLPPLPSLYHEAGREPHYYDLRFLHSFAVDLGKPVTLDGRERIEYVPTQVVTEYLRFIPDFAVDGILFRSAQNNGVNCVLFCDASGCVDSGAKSGSDEGACLRLLPDTVQWVRIAAKAVIGPDRHR
ncbi:hypothetical protein JOF56_008070 [Kibdelosporangium banguiense]|uniref:RES domain-containing protein n=1 Tax=Kibdelosporangium banguiense TaxID=1365924 RepID=A0ABS4TTG1_9PSEU|nr:RES domain-containing protein [Kibdelosporangium banguiense]MBP2327685.1 hypothetical protein [Kibdelosporangium banguiense]